MKLGDLCDIRYNMPEADFYIYARGSEKNLGMPSKDSENTEKKIGFKVKDEAKEVLDSGYLYYLFMHRQFYVDHVKIKKSIFCNTRHLKISIHFNDVVI